MQRTCDSLVTIWWMQLLADWCGVCDGHALRAPRHAMSAPPARFERVCVTVGLATFEPATFGRRLGWLLERRARYVCVLRLSRLRLSRLRLAVGRVTEMCRK